jgi:hypothetical protein
MVELCLLYLDDELSSFVVQEGYWSVIWVYHSAVRTETPLLRRPDKRAGEVLLTVSKTSKMLLYKNDGHSPFLIGWLVLWLFNIDVTAADFI